MLAILPLLTTFAANLFKSRRQLEVENLFLRHQLNIALRRARRRLRLRGSDRAVLVWLHDCGQASSDWLAWFSRTPFCGGIAQDFGPIGAGNRAADPGDLE
jgi:hypothetical protein